MFIDRESSLSNCPQTLNLNECEVKTILFIQFIQMIPYDFVIEVLKRVGKSLI